MTSSGTAGRSSCSPSARVTLSALRAVPRLHGPQPSRTGDVDAQAASGASDEPDLFVSHVLVLQSHCACCRRQRNQPAPAAARRRERRPTLSCPVVVLMPRRTAPRAGPLGRKTAPWPNHRQRRGRCRGRCATGSTGPIPRAAPGAVTERRVLGRLVSLSPVGRFARLVDSGGFPGWDCHARGLGTVSKLD